MQPGSDRLRDLWLGAGLLMAVLAAYWGIGQCGFVSLDDAGYVVQQPMVVHGLRPAAFLWMISGWHGGNWHPLTSLSHTLDCTLFGISPGPMHWENLLWHAVNIVLVFVVFQKIGLRSPVAALVAAGFGLHPLHVESVAWISERKDLLSAFFWLLTMGFHVDWVRGPTRTRYFKIVVCCSLALLSKPMAVGIPVTLLLLDFWPLRRWPANGTWPLIREKLPFFGLAAIQAVVTLVIQRSAGANAFGDFLVIEQRIGNAAVSYARYLGKTFWPEKLVVMYPHPGWWPWMAVIGAGMVLLTITGVAAWQSRSRPWLLFGWLWFLVTLAPTIGLVQVGFQSMADRYTYVPLLGVFVILAMGLSEAVTRWPRVRGPIVAGTLCLLALLGWRTRQQVAVWKSGVTLFEHAVRQMPASPKLRMYLADALQDDGRSEPEVADQFVRALELDPEFTEALLAQAGSAARHGYFLESEALLNKARRLRPNDGPTTQALAGLRSLQRRFDESLEFYDRAVRLEPGSDRVRRDRASIYFVTERYRDAQREMETAIRLNWWNAVNHEKLGLVFEREGAGERSRISYERALWIDPGCVDARAGWRRVVVGQP